MSERDEYRKIWGSHPPLSLKPALPKGVWYSDENDNFYGTETRRGMGMAFWTNWRARKHEFPTKAVTPADKRDGEME